MTRALLALAALLLALAAPAAAQEGRDRVAPPGNSAIDEYMETVPGASGDRAPRAPSRDAAPVLAPEQREALVRDGGEDGEQLAKVIDATAPDDRRAGTAAPPTGAPAPAAGDTPQDAPSPLRATLSATLGANDAGGLGILFPLILAVSLVAIVALALRRRRLPL